jgi:diadenosine tetraphosphate (Ap4A) HIT family hydrolase
MQISLVTESEIFTPDGYNIGTNIGYVAGQSVMHCHIHVIPRYHGDIKDPAGGIRGVIPKKMDY